MLLSARSIAKSHGLKALFRAVTLSIDEGERVGLIGPNGAGKSTLLKILAGHEAADDGSVAGGRGLRAVYVPQEDRFRDAEGATAHDVCEAAALRAGVGAGVHDQHEAEIVAGMVLSRVGFADAGGSGGGGGGAARTDAEPPTLSGGWRKRLSIARALCECGGEPDLLLLDEPTNHLDLEGIRWLEALLTRPVAAGRPFASVFVTHDRAFLENVATRVVELSAAYPQGTLSVQGNYTEFLRRKEEFLSGQARAEQALANQVRKDLAWLARGPQARRTKSQSRIDSSHARIDELATLKGRNAAAATGGARVDFSGSDRRTRKFIEGKGLAVHLPDAAAPGGRRTLFSGVDIELGAGDCLGLLGPNGSGKSTLIRVLTGEQPPTEGLVKRSDPPPRVAVFSQHRTDFPRDMPLGEALCPVSDQVRFRGQTMHITAWSRRFLFRDEQLLQPVGALSGGELARVHIARVMLDGAGAGGGADVLVLDEPTNDLDIPTLEVLEEALEDFPGALVLVTHDRAMLGRLATRVLSLDGRGGARTFVDLDQTLAAQAAAERAERASDERGPPRVKAGESGGPGASSPAAGAAPPAKRKLSYNEQREYDGMEARILEAEEAAAAAEARVNDPAVMADHARMARACSDLEAAQGEVARLYARWEELEAKRQ